MSSLVTARDFQVAMQKASSKLCYSNCDRYIEEFSHKLDMKSKTLCTDNRVGIFDMEYEEYNKEIHGPLQDSQVYTKFTVWYLGEDVLMFKLHKWDDDMSRIGDKGAIRASLVDYSHDMSVYGQLALDEEGNFRLSPDSQEELKRYGLLG